MNIKYLFILIFLSIGFQMEAQQIFFRPISYLGISNNVKTGYFYDGGGFELGYAQEQNVGRIVGGVNYRLIHWGHQMGIFGGYDYPFWQQNSWRASVNAQAEIAAGLFVQRPLFGWSIGVTPTLEWQSRKAFFAQLGLGLQLNNNPPYSEYGAINTTLDIPVKIGFGFRLGGNNEK